MACSTPIARDAASPKTCGLWVEGRFPKEMGYIHQKKVELDISQA